MDSKPFRVLLTVGLIAYGVVHILIGWIALQIAWSGRPEGEEASQQGALAELAGQPFGAVLLWIVVIGLFALTVWQTRRGDLGTPRPTAGIKRIRKRLGSAGRTITYAAIAIAAIDDSARIASRGDSKEEGWTARLLSAPFGRILVIAVGDRDHRAGRPAGPARHQQEVHRRSRGRHRPGGRPAGAGGLHRQGHRLRHRRWAVRLGGDHLRRGEGRRPGRRASYRATRHPRARCC